MFSILDARTSEQALVVSNEDKVQARGHQNESDEAAAPKLKETHVVHKVESQDVPRYDFKKCE